MFCRPHSIVEQSGQVRFARPFWGMEISICDFGKYFDALMLYEVAVTAVVTMEKKTSAICEDGLTYRWIRAVLLCMTYWTACDSATEDLLRNLKKKMRFFIGIKKILKRQRQELRFSREKVQDISGAKYSRGTVRNTGSERSETLSSIGSESRIGGN